MSPALQADGGKEFLKGALRGARALPLAYTLRDRIRWCVDPAFRAGERMRSREFVSFRQAHGAALQCRLNGSAHARRKALVASIGFVDGIKAELGLIKGLQLAGCEPVVLIGRDPWLAQYYRLAGVRDIQCWDDVLKPVSPEVVETAFQSIGSCHELIALQEDGVRVGRFAVSTALRRFRVGSFDVQSPEVRRQLMPYLARAMAYARAAARIVRRIRPGLAMFVDKGYTPQGELFDVCINADVDAVIWNTAHKSNTLMLKRYRAQNHDDHPASLSDSTWAFVQRMDWTPAHRQRLQEELSRSYLTGDWFSEVGTQFNTRLLDAEEIRRRLGLDPRKKVAVIFPHILWDGTFFWGEDLFRSYEEWFVETVRAACANDQVNWVIKIHPANIVKNVRDGLPPESAEMVALRKRLGPLPAHLFVVPADSEISTYSLFGLMDSCLTVRGTIGIEAASMGVPVLTAGTGRYDRKGFTIDSASREEYLARLARLHEIPPLSPAQRELAERFAWGIFILRPLSLRTFTLAYQRDAKASLITRINALTREDWLAAQDVRAVAEWVTHSQELDFLTPQAEETRVCRA
ncbi:MAG: hypothetical protein HYZ91_06705 [Candidatus Omnitrophica bacterium]|nr:hypothetical protein [Candidatus Omnitrophota bacterium]